MWEQGMDWLRGNSALQMQTYALLVGTLYFVFIWLTDHAGSHFMGKWLPNMAEAPGFQHNILGLLRRVLLLSSTVMLMALDYGPMVQAHLPAFVQELGMAFWVIPIALLSVLLWLQLEVWIFGRLLPPDLSPSMVDFVRMSARSKQTLISTPGYAQLSTQVNRVLYLLAYVHLVMLVYGFRAR